MKRLPSPVKVGLLAVAVIAFALAASADRSRAYPSFSVGSPSISAAPGDVLDPVPGAPFPGPTPPGVVATVISGAALGVGAAGNIDGLSYGDDFPWGALGTPHFYEFSVDTAARGGPWLPLVVDNVRTQGVTVEGGAGADIFVTSAGLPFGTACTPPFRFNNLLYDGDGFTALSGPVLGVGGLFDLPLWPPMDNIDAYEARDVSAVDYLTALTPVPPPPPPVAGGDGIPDGAVFFSVDPATAVALGVSAADILVTDPGSPTGWSMYAPAGMLGLTPADNIDALLVADSATVVPGPGGTSPPPRTFGPHPTDFVAFSLAPGSPSLPLLPLVCGGPNSPGDVWYVSPFFGGPAPLVAAEDLGLCSARIPGCLGVNDNLDAIDISWGPGGDIDSDGLPDGMEVLCGTAVGPSDTDGDGILDGTEAVMSTNPVWPCTGLLSAFNPDSDADGLIDGWELAYWTVGCMSTNPSVPDAGADTDADGLTNMGEQTAGTSPCNPDSDSDLVLDGSDNCPTVSNNGQQNTDSGPPPSGGGGIGNGVGIPGNDATVPNGDALGDACDPDLDNDGIPNTLDLNPSGDITYDDNNNGNMCPADILDNGPSWDSDCNAILDGWVGGCGGGGDTDTDGLLDKWENCKWGTNPAVIDSDRDTRGDCKEAADVDGNGAVNLIDVVAYAKAALLAPAAFGRDGDFDIDGNSQVNLTDVVQEAKFGLIGGLCK